MDEAETMVDQMAKTASTTNTSVAQLGEGILTIGATAKSIKGGTAAVSYTHLAETGVTSTGTSITFDDVMDLYYSLRAPYRNKAVWLLNDSTVKADVYKRQVSGTEEKDQARHVRKKACI